MFIASSHHDHCVKSTTAQLTSLFALGANTNSSNSSLLPSPPAGTTTLPNSAKPTSSGEPSSSDSIPEVTSPESTFPDTLSGSQTSPISSATTSQVSVIDLQNSRISSTSSATTSQVSSVVSDSQSSQIFPISFATTSQASSIDSPSSQTSAISSVTTSQVSSIALQSSQTLSESLSPKASSSQISSALSSSSQTVASRTHAPTASPVSVTDHILPSALIDGYVIGSVACLPFILLCIFLYLRCRRRRRLYLSANSDRWRSPLIPQPYTVLAADPPVFRNPPRLLTASLNTEAPLPSACTSDDASALATRLDTLQDTVTQVVGYIQHIQAQMEYESSEAVDRPPTYALEEP
ncbi:hypothetical protein D9757_014179 [Collybiopsis confluens]|uniref:Uncharacterized protein n=1 Tax=Collybiopsis confluens TaxID=2823264 RepID=A0A8H5CL68_9AGAR|nr:hypothetical protein D9757_014179 [Collybiopsis confluens]